MFKDYPLTYLPVYTHINTYIHREKGRQAGRQTDRHREAETDRGKGKILDQFQVHRGRCDLLPHMHSFLPYSWWRFEYKILP